MLLHCKAINYPTTHCVLLRHHLARSRPTYLHTYTYIQYSLSVHVHVLYVQWTCMHCSVTTVDTDDLTALSTSKVRTLYILISISYCCFSVQRELCNVDELLTATKHRLPSVQLTLCDSLTTICYRWCRMQDETLDVHIFFRSIRSIIIIIII